MHRLEGRVALVTGAARGIGRGIATKLAAEGARLVINDLDEAPLRALAGQLQADGHAVACVPGSVSDAGFADRFVAEALQQFGAIDLLVNNAGYIWNSRIDKTTDEQWAAMLDVHLGAPFRITRRVVQHWKQQPMPAAADGQAAPHRKIVNVSSVSGTHGAAGQVAYASAKAGLVGLPRAGLEALRASIPLRRGGTPDEAAGGVLLLCLPEADYITGQVLEVDGGLAI